MDREHREIASFMVDDVQEHYHHIPGQDGNDVCVDVVRWLDGRVVTVGWYSLAGFDRNGLVDFTSRVAA